MVIIADRDRGRNRGRDYKMVKLSPPEGAILTAAALFLAFSAGWLLRGQYGGAIRVETERRLTEEQRTVTSTPSTEGKVDINRATEEELSAIPGIGEALAADIVSERERGGPFLYPEDLTRVKGIGEGSIQSLMDYITVGDGI